MAKFIIKWLNLPIGCGLEHLEGSQEPIQAGGAVILVQQSLDASCAHCRTVTCGPPLAVVRHFLLLPLL